MCLLHKWGIKYSQPKWDYYECMKCGKRKTVEKMYGGYQIKNILIGINKISI